VIDARKRTRVATTLGQVGVDIANGRIVDAANPCTGVRGTGLHSMPIIGAG